LKESKKAEPGHVEHARIRWYCRSK